MLTNKKTETNITFDIINLKEKLLKEKNLFIPARTSKLPAGSVEKIITEIGKHYKLESRDEVIAVLAILFQQGGTARGCDGNLSITLFGKEFKLADIRKILKQCSCSKAERKLARSLANEIYQISLIMETPGNLYSKIQKKDLNKLFTMEQKVWLSDFQSENEKCPTELRTLILDTFKKPEKDKKK